MPRPAKLSQTHLAKELGVSQALVSLVLNGRKAGISPETYDRIWDHAVKRGYRPKGMHLASAPASTQLHQVGFILRAGLKLHTPSAYFGHVQHGLHLALEARGYTSVFLGYEDDLDDDKLARLFAPGRSFQGVVLMGEVARPFLEKLRRLDPRIVAVSARFPGLSHSVIGNEPQALDQLVTHLHGLGHRRFGWLGGNVGLGRHESRLSAFQEALGRVQLTLDPRYTITLEQGDRAEGTEAMLNALAHEKRKDFPTAFVCYNSSMAAGALIALGRADWRVPRDVSIAAADISRSATEAKPSLTAAGSSPERLGEVAARLILDSTGGADESFTDKILASQLHVGDTTGPAPA